MVVKKKTWITKVFQYTPSQPHAVTLITITIKGTRCAVYYGVLFIYQYMQSGVRIHFGSVCLAVSPRSRAPRYIFTHRCIVRAICACALPTSINLYGEAKEAQAPIVCLFARSFHWRSEVTTFRFTCTYICCVGQLRYD
jgi:hypothetical protein